MYDGLSYTNSPKWSFINSSSHFKYPAESDICRIHLWILCGTQTEGTNEEGYVEKLLVKRMAKGLN